MRKSIISLATILTLSCNESYKEKVFEKISDRKTFAEDEFRKFAVDHQVYKGRVMILYDLDNDRKPDLGANFRIFKIKHFGDNEEITFGHYAKEVVLYKNNGSKEMYYDLDNDGVLETKEKIRQVFY